MYGKQAKDRKEQWLEQKLSPVELLKQDAECLAVFLQLEGRDTGQWMKGLKNWEPLLQKLSVHGQSVQERIVDEIDIEEIEEQLLEQGLDLTSDQMMALSACYEQQGVLPAPNREYLMVVNTTAYDREDILESEGHLRLFADGKALPVQWTEETTLWKPECIPSHGFRVFEAIQTEEEESFGTIVLNPETLIMETPYYRVQFNEVMELASVLDKESGQELLGKGRAGNVLYAGKERMTELVSVELAEQGAVRTVLQIVKRFQSSYVVQELVFYEDSTKVEIRTSCVWQEQNLPLKLCFSFAEEGKKTAIILEDGSCCMGEETERCIPIVSENSAEQTEGQEFVCYLFPYEEENAVRKEACLISNSAYQLAGQLPFRKKEHRYVQVSDETVLVERIKPEENGEEILLWLQETAGRETAVAVTIAGEQGEVSEVSLQGQPMKPLERRIVCLKRGKKKK